MRRALSIALLIALAASPAMAGDAVTVLQEKRTVSPEKRTRQKGKRHEPVEHVALIQNTSPRSIHALRVTVELHDAFGKLLWTHTVTPGPSSLGPGETASLSVSTPNPPDYKKTVYRFDYRTDPGRRRP